MLLGPASELPNEQTHFILCLVSVRSVRHRVREWNDKSTEKMGKISRGSASKQTRSSVKDFWARREGGYFDLDLIRTD